MSRSFRGAVCEEPFVTLLKQEPPKGSCIQAPGFASLNIGPIEFIIDEGRYQVKETGVSDWIDTKVIQITKKYYEILPYTPLKVLGINLNYSIVFESPDEAQEFQHLYFLKTSNLAKIISNSQISASVNLKYPYPQGEGRISIAINFLDTEANKSGINFNYEFNCVDSSDNTDWTLFTNGIGRFPEIISYSEEIINQIIASI